MTEKWPKWSKIAVLGQKKNLIKLQCKTWPLNPTKLASQIKTDREKGRQMLHVKRQPYKYKTALKEG